MAGTIVHLLVAEKLFRLLSGRKSTYFFDKNLVPQEDEFIAGNICPDGIMARKGYCRQMKLHSHFRDNIPDGEFELPGNARLFEARMKEFWMEHIDDERRRPGLYLGYITHMMVDEKFILEERPKYFVNISAIGLTKWDKETYVHFNRDTDCVDFRLLREYPELDMARKSLERVEPYEITGMITQDELTCSRQWILNHFFYTEHSEVQSEYLSYEDMAVFVDKVTENIVTRLFDDGYLL